jgi:lambda family phage portal protein
MAQQSTKPGILSRVARLWRRADPPRRAQRGFAAARLDRFTAEWLAVSKSINEELRTDLDRLRQRGRELTNNNDYARKFRGMVENNIIGPGGVRLQARIEDAPGRPDRMANDAVETAWEEWQRECDLAGRMHFRDLCENLVGGLPSDGEFLVRMVRGADAGNRFNFALQVIDVDRIDTHYNGTYEGRRVIMGVEVDGYDRALAVHVLSVHPSEAAGSARQRERVPMENLIHGFKVERAGQVRGIPWMAPGMLSLHHLGGFMLSALLAAEHGANHFGFFLTPDGQPPIGLPDETTGQTISTSQPGTFDTLPTGYDFKPFDSKYPSETFGPFVKTALQRVATGWRVAYVSLANDLDGVNYSSIRSGVLEERDRWAADQEWFTKVFMEPVYRAWLDMALLSGAVVASNGSPLPATKKTKFMAHEWQPRRWEWVDPQGDIAAKILMVKAGLMAPQDLAAAMGYDFEDTIKAIAAAQALAAEFGVTLPAYDSMPGANSGTEATPQGGATASAAGGARQ